MPTPILPDVATKSQSEARYALADALTRMWSPTYGTIVAEHDDEARFTIGDMRSMALESIRLVQETIGDSTDRLAEALYDVDHGSHGVSGLNAMGALVAAVRTATINADKILGGER